MPRGLFAFSFAFAFVSLCDALQNPRNLHIFTVLLTMPLMKASMFREYSIRGIADTELPDEVVRRIGQAAGTYFLANHGNTVTLGRDYRLSSSRLSAALAEGLLAAGANVIDVGEVPTPLLNFATDLYRASGGIMVTASHNPPEHNGFKMRARDTLRGPQLTQIREIALEGSFVEGRGELQKKDPTETYLRHLKERADLADARPLHVVVDGGSGTNGRIVASLLRELGCRVSELFCEPDGSFPYRAPDPTAQNALEDLVYVVQDEKADVGFAYDGDGDRVVAVDDGGNVLLGDKLLLLLAYGVLKNGPARIVHELSCTRALRDYVTAKGGEAIPTPVGYAFIHEKMLEADADIGGEVAGHFFFKDPLFRFDDSILATVRLLGLLSVEERPLSAIMESFPVYYQSPTFRIDCPDAVKEQVVQNVRAHYGSLYPVSDLDGAMVDFGDGWALVRKSNTQPAVTARIEAASGERLAALQNEVLEKIRDELADLV